MNRSTKVPADSDYDPRSSGSLRLHSSLTPNNRGRCSHIQNSGCSKGSSIEASGESKPEAYPLGYVEHFDEPRTKLGSFFSSLLGLRTHFHVEQFDLPMKMAPLNFQVFGRA